ncbi:MAG TPA: DUF2188 domain-containing protein [Bacteroidia bacterium]|nr:DUF2188 domain-containing protein [Bacteroidia bacterium]
MNKGKNQHVVPTEDGWGVRGEKNDRLTKEFDNKADAIDYAREIAKNQQAELVIHNRDGKISDKDSYGPDPNPPKDQKH